MVAIYYIYVIINKCNNKLYIGKSKNPKRRFQKHISQSNYPGPKHYLIHKAIKKYGFSMFYLEIIDEAFNEEEAYQKEIEWISFCKSNDRKFGYNLTSGGEGNRNFIMTEPMKKHLSNMWLGSKSKQSKLTETQVIDIHKLYQTGKYTQKELSIKFNISENQISKIISGKCWPHIFEQFKSFDYSKIKKTNKSHVYHCGEKTPGSKLTEFQVIEIKQKYSKGKKIINLSKEYNVKSSTINSIIIGKNWKHIKDV